MYVFKYVKASSFLSKRTSDQRTNVPIVKITILEVSQMWSSLIGCSILYRSCLLFYFRINSQIARIRSEETASKPPDISALEDDMEAAAELAAEIEESLKTLVAQQDAAVEVNKLKN